MSQCHPTSSHEGVLNTKARRNGSHQLFPITEKRLVAEHTLFHHHRKLLDSDKDKEEKKKKKKEKKEKKKKKKSSANPMGRYLYFCYEIPLVKRVGK
ncbi:unnamed protein product [Sphenostylis stenocarpa]|uniref:Uncharacterized protein n=1 Tax=Sphenostylis stenocarpa TaxID=92480 RepID=A0AA86T7U1_9FABA|nr:unnamed protein product [Sphenostylis stenocarpa]